MKRKSIEQLVQECMELRGTGTIGLSHRTLIEFGNFVNCVMNYNFADKHKYTKYLKIRISNNAITNWFYRFRQYCEDEYGRKHFVMQKKAKRLKWAHIPKDDVCQNYCKDRIHPTPDECRKCENNPKNYKKVK